MLVPVTDPFTSLEDGIRGLLTSQLDLFVQMGHNLFRGFATILIVWFGVQAALSSAEGGEGFSFARFSRLLLVVAFGFAMVTYYSTPIPGIGYSFSDLVIQEASSLSNGIGLAGSFRDRRSADRLAQFAAANMLSRSHQKRSRSG